VHEFVVQKRSAQADLVAIRIEVGREVVGDVLAADAGVTQPEPVPAA